MRNHEGALAEWALAEEALAEGALAVVCAVLLLLSATTATYAASGKAIDIKVDATLERFYSDVDGGRAFADAAEGMLIFPSVLKAGIGIGGEYGEGALRVGGATVAYYSTAAASIGFQLGAQAKTIVLVFIEKAALEKFQASAGWEVGVDGSVALITVGAGGSIDTTNIKDPIVGFVFNNKGLMYNLTLEGSKITRLNK